MDYRVDIELDRNFLYQVFGEDYLAAFKIIKGHMQSAWKILEVELGNDNLVEGLRSIHALDEYGDVVDEMERGFNKALEELNVTPTLSLRVCIEKRSVWL